MGAAKCIRVNATEFLFLFFLRRLRFLFLSTLIDFAGSIEMHGFPIDRVLERSKLLTISLELLIKIKWIKIVK